ARATAAARGFAPGTIDTANFLAIPGPQRESNAPDAAIGPGGLAMVALGRQHDTDHTDRIFFSRGWPGTPLTALTDIGLKSPAAPYPQLQIAAQGQGRTVAAWATGNRLQAAQVGAS